MTAAVAFYTIRYERRPWTLNAERSGSTHHFKRAELVREWRQAFAGLAMKAKVPPLERVFILAAPEVKDRRSIPDTGACIGAVKAAIDGLVDVGVLDGDGPDRVLLLSFVAPVVTGVDALAVHVIDCSDTVFMDSIDLPTYLRSVS